MGEVDRRIVKDSNPEKPITRDSLRCLLALTRRIAVGMFH